MSMKYLNDSTDPCQISTYKKILLCSPAGSVLLSTTAGGACLFVIIYVGWCEGRVSTGLGAGGSFTWPMFGGSHHGHWLVDNVDLQS